MTDLSSNTSRSYRSRLHSLALLTTNGEEYYAGSAVGLKLSTGRAVCVSTSSTEHVRFVGWCEQRVSGDGTNTVAVRCDGAVIERATVTGASAATDVGQLVYMTDDQTFTLTRPSADAVPVGIVSRWHSGTTCDVLSLTIGESLALDSARPRETRMLGTVGLNSIALNDVVCSQQLWGHGRIVGFHSYPARKAPAATSGATVFQLLLGASGLGDLALAAGSGASGMFEFVAGDCASSINYRFSDGDVVTVKVKTATTAWNSSGAASFFVDIEPA
ncbi:MAG: hypothetical protein AB7K09_15325 [Planctomycetota bacterium]